MSTRTAGAFRHSHDPHGAAMAAGACGIGGLIAYVGVASAAPLLAIGGAALLALGLAFVLAGNWIDPLATLVVALPMPALYETTELRIAPAVVMSALLLVAWLLRAASDPPVMGARTMPADARRMAVAIALLLAAVLVTSVFADARAAAAREIVNWLLLAGVLFIAVLEMETASRRRMLAMTIGIVAAACGVIGVLQTVGVLPARFPLRGSGWQRATAGFGWPNELGMFLAIALPYAVYVRSQALGSAQRMLASAGVGAVILGLLATFSRGSWLAALLAPAALVAVGERRRALRIWLAALVICVLVDVLSGGALRDRLASTIGDWVIEQRAALTLAGVLMFGANPLLGVGPGGFAHGLDEYGPRITWLWDYLPTAQNSYVQFAAEMGIAGVAVFVGVVVVVMRALLRLARSAAPEDAMLQQTTLWAFTTAVLVAFSEWIFAHGIGQLVLLTAAIGMTGAAARTGRAP